MPTSRATVKRVEQLMLLLAQFGQATSQALLAVAGDQDLVGNGPIIVLCELDLEGPRRPGAIGELTGLSSGGVTKLLDRLEQRGLVARSSVDGDRRGVLVSITPAGRRLVHRYAATIADYLGDVDGFVTRLRDLAEP